MSDQRLSCFIAALKGDNPTLFHSLLMRFAASSKQQLMRVRWFTARESRLSVLRAGGEFPGEVQEENPVGLYQLTHYAL
jgi:hypothetical protein